MNLYHIRIHETNGENEYYFHRVVKCKTQKEAEEIAEETAKHWYPVPDKLQQDEDDHTYYFNCGQLAAEVDVVRKTTEKKFIKEFIWRK
jgi:hypothetical protein